MTDSPRSIHLEEGLRAVRARIDAAVSDCGRSDAPTLVVVTKRFPASDVTLLHELGVRDVGESQAQEFSGKYADLESRGDLTLHFIGQLQSNKAGLVSTLADVVHTVDRAKIARSLDRHRAEVGRPLDILLQVSLDGDPQRGGVRPEDLSALAEVVAACEHLTLRGLMAVPPLGTDPDAEFARLRGLADGIRRDHPEADWLSAGMSGDLEAAVRQGATHLRVGTAILGSRQSLG